MDQRVDDAKADVMYLADAGLWATWLSAPFPTNHVNTLHACLRNFQARDQDSGWIIVSTGHHSMMRQGFCSGVDTQNAGLLCDFLANFLRGDQANPLQIKSQRAIRGRGNQRSGPTIQKVAINIDFDSDWNAAQETPQYPLTQTSLFIDLTQTTINQQLLHKHYHRMVPSSKRNALAVAESLYRHLLEVLDPRPRFFSATSFPDIIFERIGTIDINVGSRPFRNLDLGQILAELPRREAWTDVGFSRSEFFEWKRNAEQERRTAGFGMVRPSVKEEFLVGSSALVASMLSKRCENLVRDVATSSEDIAPAASMQSARNESIAFTGKAMLFQKDGNLLPGNATFYSSSGPNWSTYIPNIQSVVNDSEPYCPEQDIEELPQDDEVALFKGETIVFQSCRIDPAIISGDATFYGRAGEARTEPPGTI